MCGLSAAYWSWENIKQHCSTWIIDYYSLIIPEYLCGDTKVSGQANTFNLPWDKKWMMLLIPNYEYYIRTQHFLKIDPVVQYIEQHGWKTFRASCLAKASSHFLFIDFYCTSNIVLFFFFFLINKWVKKNPTICSGVLQRFIWNWFLLQAS